MPTAESIEDQSPERSPRLIPPDKLACRKHSDDDEADDLPGFNQNPTRPVKQRLLLNADQSALFERQNRAKNAQIPLILMFCVRFYLDVTQINVLM
jgi:hypothetical protein